MSPTLNTNDKTCPKTCPGEEVPLVGGSQEMPGKPGEGRCRVGFSCDLVIFLFLLQRKRDTYTWRSPLRV